MVNDQVRSMPLSKSDCLTEKAWPLFSLNQKYLKTVAQAEGFDIHPPDCPHRPQVAPTLPPRSCSQPQLRPHAVPPPPVPPHAPARNCIAVSTVLPACTPPPRSLHDAPTPPPRLAAPPPLGVWRKEAGIWRKSGRSLKTFVEVALGDTLHQLTHEQAVKPKASRHPAMQEQGRRSTRGDRS